MRLVNKIFGKANPLNKRKEDINLPLLQQIIDDVENKRKKVSFVPLTLDDAEISFMLTKDHQFVGMDDGLWDCYEREKYQIAIKQKLPVNAKNYHRIIQKNGKVERIESYVDGRLDVIHLAYYEGDRKYLFPFMPDGSEYPTYTYVSVYKNGQITEVYHTESSHKFFSNISNLMNEKRILSLLMRYQKERFLF